MNTFIFEALQTYFSISMICFSLLSLFRISDFVKYTAKKKRIEQMQRQNKGCEICYNHLKEKYNNTIMNFYKNRRN